MYASYIKSAAAFKLEKLLCPSESAISMEMERAEKPELEKTERDSSIMFILLCCLCVSLVSKNVTRKMPDVDLIME